jgi:predicted dehydrogenase
MPSANPEIKVLKPEVINEEPLRAELQSFLQTVSTREQPVVSLEDGRRALAAALEITTQIKHHAAKLGLQ